MKDATKENKLNVVKGSAEYQSSQSNTMSGISGSTRGSLNSGESGSANRIEEMKGNYTTVMHERWHRSNQYIPSLDRRDYMEECPIFNNGKKSTPEHQQHPEYTQTSYTRLRSLEEAFVMSNYLDEANQKSAEKMSFTQRISNTFHKKMNSGDQMTPYDRSYGI